MVLVLYRVGCFFMKCLLSLFCYVLAMRINDVKNFIIHFDCLYVLPDNLQVYPDPEERCRLTPACM